MQDIVDLPNGSGESVKPMGWEAVELSPPTPASDMRKPMAPSVPTGKTSATGVKLPEIKGALTMVAQLILESDVRAIQVEENPEGFVQPPIDHVTRTSLAMTIGVSMEDLQEVVDGVNQTFGGDTWSMLILSARTANMLASATVRKQGWDNLESKALKKLEILVDQDKIRTPGDLLAIATAANRANRNPNMQQQVIPAGGTQINIFGDSAVKSDINSGDMGTIKLELSPRVRKQLESKRPDSTEILRNAKMIDATALRQFADDSKEQQDATK